jgi:molecular chaperone GrpE (heat shock protein)
MNNSNESDLSTLLSQSEDTQQLVQEIAEDMEPIIRIINRIDQRQTAIETRIDQIEQQVQGGAQAHARELDKLRKELLSEQGTTLGVSLFNVIGDALENLNSIMGSLEADSKLYHNAGGIVVMLESMLRNVHISKFTVEPGEPFDPSRMRVEDFEDSEIDGVVRTTKYGYMIKDQVLREASVIVSRQV